MVPVLIKLTSRAKPKNANGRGAELDKKNGCPITARTGIEASCGMGAGYGSFSSASERAELCGIEFIQFFTLFFHSLAEFA